MASNVGTDVDCGRGRKSIVVVPYRYRSWHNHMWTKNSGGKTIPQYTQGFSFGSSDGCGYAGRRMPRIHSAMRSVREASRTESGDGRESYRLDSLFAGENG